MARIWSTRDFMPVLVCGVYVVCIYRVQCHIMYIDGNVVKQLCLLAKQIHKHVSDTKLFDSPHKHHIMHSTYIPGPLYSWVVFSAMSSSVCMMLSYLYRGFVSDCLLWEGNRGRERGCRPKES